MSQSTYDPAEFQPLTFHDAVLAFGDTDSPRAYLERCLEVIDAREPTVKAWVTLNQAGARAAADASTSRYKAGRPLSTIDGMPVGIKDILQTKDSEGFNRIGSHWKNGVYQRVMLLRSIS